MTIRQRPEVLLARDEIVAAPVERAVLVPLLPFLILCSATAVVNIGVLA